MKEFIMIGLLVLSVLAIQTSAAYEVDKQGKITSILDGDTVKMGDLKIRFMIVDAPELGTRSTADDAKEFVKQHCLNKNATLDINDPNKKDSSGRTLAIVHCGTDVKPINQILLEEDYAVNYRYFSCTQPNEFVDLDWVKC